MPRQPAVHQKPFEVTTFDIGERPPLNSFTYVDSDALEHCLMELEAARMLAQVQTVIRQNRHNNVTSLSDVPPIARDVDSIVHCLVEKQEKSATFSGIVVANR
jgi:hypothetical protein